LPWGLLFSSSRGRLHSSIYTLKQQAPRLPHIVTFEEEEKLLAAAVPYLRVLIVLILETGMRSHKEALSLRWDAIDFMNNFLRVRESKTRAGIRNIPLSTRCKAELLCWRKLLGVHSPFVFPNFRDPSQPAKDIRKTWTKALKDAGIEYFWLYNLRHSYASRLSAAGVSDLFVAQMIGHSSPGIRVPAFCRDIPRQSTNTVAMQSGSLSSCVRHTSNRAGWIRTQINIDLSLFLVSGFILHSDASFGPIFQLGYYSFNYS
jgi:integrase